MTAGVAPAYTAFPLLAEPTSYQRCKWDLVIEHEKRAYWLGLFRSHFPKLLAEALREALSRGEAEADVQQRMDAASTQFEQYLAAVETNPSCHGSLDIFGICLERERVLRCHHFDDPYRLAKQLENDSAMAQLPQLLDELDAIPNDQRPSRIIRGIFAGNIFDLGATKTVDLFADQRVDFYDTLDKLKARPWFNDDLDAWMRRLMLHVHRAAVLFVDNAGPDVVLGMIPFARELLGRGTRVILTANATPSLNDVTHTELQELIEKTAAIDAVVGDALSEGRLQLVSSGNAAPLIDLSRVSVELAEMVEREAVDLVVLEGMGRAVESNYDTPMSCDCLKLAMIKDPGVAEALGASLYDLVMRFQCQAEGS